MITENFNMLEFSISDSYPHLAKGVPYGFQDEIKALVKNVLQPLRSATGWRCRITSGYRSPELNKAVGGVATSQHVKGEAADTQWYAGDVKVSTYNVMKKAKEMGLPFDQMIGYPTFVHFSHTFKKPNRKQVLYNKSYKGKRV